MPTLPGSTVTTYAYLSAIGAVLATARVRTVCRAVLATARHLDEIPGSHEERSILCDHDTDGSTGSLTRLFFDLILSISA